LILEKNIRKESKKITEGYDELWLNVPLIDKNKYPINLKLLNPGDWIGKYKVVGYKAGYSQDKVFIRLMKIESKKITEAEKWSKDVDTKVKEQPGILSGSSSEIASKAKSQHNGDLGAAIKGLTFRKNQAGSNMSDSMKKNIEGAIKILHDQNEKEKK